MNQQELFPDFTPAVAPVVANQNMVFEGDVRWLFETSTGLDLPEFVDAAFYRVGWSGTEPERASMQSACEEFILNVFTTNADFAAEISRPDTMPHRRIDAEVKRFLKQ